MMKKDTIVMLILCYLLIHLDFTGSAQKCYVTLTALL